MADRSPIKATAVGGRVLIDVDPETARDLIDAFWAAHENNTRLAADRPGWFGDVVELLCAAGGVPKPVHVPVVSFPRPALRLVAGGELS